jgi:hypothetical protein
MRWVFVIKIWYELCQRGAQDVGGPGGRNVLGDDGSGPDDGAVADAHAAQDDGAAADPNLLADLDGLGDLQAGLPLHGVLVMLGTVYLDVRPQQR